MIIEYWQTEQIWIGPGLHLRAAEPRNKELRWLELRESHPNSFDMQIRSIWPLFSRSCKGPGNIWLKGGPAAIIGDGRARKERAEMTWTLGKSSEKILYAKHKRIAIHPSHAKGQDRGQDRGREQDQDRDRDRGQEAPKSDSYLLLSFPMIF